MPGILLSIDAWNRVTNARVTIRAGIARNTATLGADGLIWEPAIQTLPRFGMQLMDADLTGQLMVGVATVSLNLRNLRRVPNVEQLIFEGSPVTIYSGDGPRLSLFRKSFVGRVVSGTPDKDTGIVPLTLQVDRVLVDQPMLTKTYGGGTGADGDVELRGRTKPAAFGRPINVPPVLIDSVNSVYQFDAYGNTIGLDGVYENLASLGASVGNYATYAALVAATIPEGRYGTCLAEGMFRLGAPSTRAITCDPVCGSGTPGELGLRWLQVHAAIPTARIRTTDFSALNTALAGVVGRVPPVNHYMTDSASVLELWQRLAASCNAVPLLMLDGTFGISRIVGGDVVMTLENGKPTVTAWKNGDNPTPWWRTRMSAAIAHYVNGPSEIDFEDDIGDLGDWRSGETYRQGNIVRFTDGARYFYINATPSSTPPPDPFYWSIWEDAPDATQIKYPSGATVAEKEPAEAGADVTGNNTSKDTNAVGGQPAANILGTLQLNGQNILGQTLRGDALAAMIDAVQYIDGKTVAATITDLRDAQAGVNQSFAQNFTLLGAKNAGGTGWAINGDSVEVLGSGMAKALSLSSIAISNDENSATINRLAEILIDDSGMTLRSVDLLDLNGNITGKVNTLTGATSEYSIYANVFKIVNPNGGQPFTPFQIADDGTVEMISVRVKTLAYEALVPLFGGDNNRLNAASGFQRIPGGLILQWGRIRQTIRGEAQFSVSFPLSFPTAVMSVQAIGYLNAFSISKDLWVQNVGEPSVNGAAFCTQASDADTQNLDGIDWFAVGY